LLSVSACFAVQHIHGHAAFPALSLLFGVHQRRCNNVKGTPQYGRPPTGNQSCRDVISRATAPAFVFHTEKTAIVVRLTTRFFRN
jgi:hypothetical protein